MPENSRYEFASDVVSTITEDYLTKPAIKAALRSGLGRPPEHHQCVPMHPYLTRFVGLGHTNPHRERCVFTVASLMAHTQAEMRVPPASGNLGVSLAQASIQGQIARATTEKSVQRVGRQTAETVCRQVVHVVVPLLSARVPVDFTLLLSDLLIWPSQQPTVRKRWLQSYYLTLPHDIDNR